MAREGEAPLAQIAKDFGLSVTTLKRWVAIADRKESGAGPAATESAEMREKGARNLSLICVGALVVCIGMAVFVFASVPWETRMPYDGKYNRSGTGIPMQIALLPVLVPILGMWRAVARPEKSPRTKAGRIRSYILLAVFVSVCMIAQWTFSKGILVAGGYLPA